MVRTAEYKQLETWKNNFWTDLPTKNDMLLLSGIFILGAWKHLYKNASIVGGHQRTIYFEMIFGGISNKNFVEP